MAEPAKYLALNTSNGPLVIQKPPIPDRDVFGTVNLIGESVVQANAAEELFAIRFPRNGDEVDGVYVALEYNNPEDNDLPIWGPGNSGVTVIRRIRVRQQTAASNGTYYYAQFWYTNANRTFDTTHYWGFHPYPQGGNPGTDPDSEWEIAGLGAGLDHTDTRPNETGPASGVVFDTWFTQALVLRKSGTAERGIFYIDLPSLGNTNIIDVNQSFGGYGEDPTISSLLAIGDSPWYEGFQHERGSFDQAQLKIFNVALDESDILAEAADMSQVVTPSGQTYKWFIKYGWADIDDLTCDAGTGRSLHWSTADKATLIDMT